MRIAALYDIHGNLPALEAVLDAIDREGVDEIVLGGDVVAGPMPRETLARLADVRLPMRCIRGNTDREIASCMRGEPIDQAPERFRAIARWVAQQLDPEQGRMIDGWPGTLRLPDAGTGEALFCHASPRNDTEVFTRFTPEALLLPMFQPLDVPLVVCGHTHMQFDRTIGHTRVVNAGSVGMPYGGSGAYWLLLAPEPQLRHTPYDLAHAAERIRATAYPQALEFADRHVLDPPSAEAFLQMIAAVEMR
jgi:predicted phosphodiesterase